LPSVGFVSRRMIKPGRGRSSWYSSPGFTVASRSLFLLSTVMLTMGKSHFLPVRSSPVNNVGQKRKIPR